MDISKLKSLIDLVSRSRVSELEITEGDERVRIVKAMAPSRIEPRAGSQALAARPADRPALREAEEHKSGASTGEVILSPMYGVFYRAPSPDSSPFVEPGQRIEKGQKICVIEAMKLFNVVEAEIEGVIEAVLVDSGQEVEAGQPLFRIG